MDKAKGKGAEEEERFKGVNEKMSETNTRKNFYVSVDDDGDLVVMEEREDGDDVVVSDKFKTKFMLCSGRCPRKEHYGEFDGKIFKCYFYD